MRGLRKWATILVLGTLLACAGSIAGTGANQGWVYDELSMGEIDLLIEAIDGVNYTRTIDDYGDPIWIVTVGYLGLRFSLVAYDDDSDPWAWEMIMAYGGFEMSYPPSVWEINDYNRTRRGVRTYLDSYGDPCIEADMYLDGGVTADAIVAFLERFIRTLDDFAEYIGFD